MAAKETRIYDPRRARVWPGSGGWDQGPWLWLGWERKEDSKDIYCSGGGKAGTCLCWEEKGLSKVADVFNFYLANGRVYPYTNTHSS